jgi:hypothetical protein
VAEALVVPTEPGKDLVTLDEGLTALARAVEERAAFLATVCAGDNVLQREVESLRSLAKDLGYRPDRSAEIEGRLRS